jgi:hypothetical protein
MLGTIIWIDICNIMIVESIWKKKEMVTVPFERQILDLHNRETTWINKSSLQARWSVTMCLQRLDKWEFLLSNPTLSIRIILLFVNIILQIKILLILIYIICVLDRPPYKTLTNNWTRACFHILYNTYRI